MHAELQRHTLTADELRARWHALANDPDSPDYYELLATGALVVSPRPTRIHQVVLGWVHDELRAKLGPRVAPEFAVLTPAGILVPDAAWDLDLLAKATSDDPAASAPALVVEVLSPGNRAGEIRDKIAAYLAAGVREVIVIDLAGAVAYHHADGAHPASRMGADLQPPPELFGSPTTTRRD